MAFALRASNASHRSTHRLKVSESGAFNRTAILLYWSSLLNLSSSVIGFLCVKWAVEARQAVDEFQKSLPRSPTPFGPELGLQVVKNGINLIIDSSEDELINRTRAPRETVYSVLISIVRDLAWEELATGKHRLFTGTRSMTGDGLVALFWETTNQMKKLGVETEETRKTIRENFRNMENSL